MEGISLPSKLLLYHNFIIINIEVNVNEEYYYYYKYNNYNIRNYINISRNNNIVPNIK